VTPSLLYVTRNIRLRGWSALDEKDVIIITTHECVVVMRSVASVCLSVCNALTFESLDLESSLLVCGYILEISMSDVYIKIIWSRLKSQEQTRSLATTERARI